MTPQGGRRLSLPALALALLVIVVCAGLAGLFGPSPVATVLVPSTPLVAETFVPTIPSDGLPEPEVPPPPDASDALPTSVLPDVAATAALLPTLLPELPTQPLLPYPLPGVVPPTPTPPTDVPIQATLLPSPTSTPVLLPTLAPTTPAPTQFAPAIPTLPAATTPAATPGAVTPTVAGVPPGAPTPTVAGAPTVTAVQATASPGPTAPNGKPSPTPASVRMTYRVEGTASQATIIYFFDNRPFKIDSIGLPWSVTLNVPPGTRLQLTAENLTGAGALRCLITIVGATTPLVEAIDSTLAVCEAQLP